jgi:hypothetical protein
MPSFAMCTYCGCNENYIAVFKCDGCSRTYCDVCSNSGFFSQKCPNCDQSGNKLGEITQ